MKQLHHLLMRVLHTALLVIVLANAARADDDIPHPFPRALIDRPLVLPRAMLELGLAFDHETQRVLGVEVLSAQSLAVRALWGVNGSVELGLATALRLHPDATWTRGFVPRFAWRVHATPRLQVALEAVLPLRFDRGYDVVTTLSVAVPTRVRLSPRWFVIAGRSLVPIDIRPAAALNLTLSAGLGLQAVSSLALVAEAELAEVTLIGQVDRTRTVVDRLPVSLTAVWGVRDGWDLRFEGKLTDATSPADGFVVGLGVVGRH